jgi:phospholipase/carboxylesterase
MSETLDFIHRFLPAPGGAGSTTPTLLLLHGTGGNEDDLLEIGRSVAPTANLLSPRGNVLENGMPRFFRRLSEGVFDEQDIVRRTDQLADFLVAAAQKYGFSPASIGALGYSNGANIAASMLLLQPAILSHAVLLRAMVPLVPKHPPDLAGKRIFLASGLSDPILPIANARQLGKMFRDAGADLTHRELQAGHQLTSGELDEVHDWLSQPLS